MCGRPAGPGRRRLGAVTARARRPAAFPAVVRQTGPALSARARTTPGPVRARPLTRILALQPKPRISKSEACAGPRPPRRRGVTLARSSRAAAALAQWGVSRPTPPGRRADDESGSPESLRDPGCQCPGQGCPAVTELRPGRPDFPGRRHPGTARGVYSAAARRGEFSCLLSPGNAYSQTRT
jgi:hypothetical protein